MELTYPMLILRKLKKYPFAIFFYSYLHNLFNNHQLLYVFSNSDAILCIGVLHHLKNDEIDDLLNFQVFVWIPTVNFICLESTFLLYHSTFSRVLVNFDRGKNVKHDHEWRVLFATHFKFVRNNVVYSLGLLPYDHILINCMYSTYSLWKYLLPDLVDLLEVP